MSFLTYKSKSTYQSRKLCAFHYKDHLILWPACLEYSSGHWYMTDWCRKDKRESHVDKRSDILYVKYVWHWKNTLGLVKIAGVGANDNCMNCSGENMLDKDIKFQEGFLKKSGYKWRKTFGNKNSGKYFMKYYTFYNLCIVKKYSSNRII